MDAELIYRRRETRRTKGDREIRVIMDLYQIPEPEGYRFSWIAFDVEDPTQRVLFDCHPPKGPHLHVNELELQLQWVSLEEMENLFFRKVQERFGAFFAADEDEKE